MTKSKVYFTNLRTSARANLLDKLEKLVVKAGIKTINFDQQFVALKIHVGEAGNIAYIRPNYVARLVELIKSLGGKPFLTDCNTLYSGKRNNAIDHLDTATQHGFNPLSAGCHMIIGDGIKGTDERAIDIQGKYCPKPLIGAAIADADIIISLNHFKGHEMAGFGGAMKNLGMGCGSVRGKMEMHASCTPTIDKSICRGCGVCVQKCDHGAAFMGPDKKADIDADKCVGCGQCIAVCPFNAAQTSSWGDAKTINYRIDEYAMAVLKGKPNFHINFLLCVSPECDCWGHNDSAIVPDLGIMASFDPVALDKASADMVNAAPALANSVLTDRHERDACCHKEKFGLLHPDTDWLAGLEYAQEIGLGSLDYDLVSLDK